MMQGLDAFALDPIKAPMGTGVVPIAGKKAETQARSLPIPNLKGSLSAGLRIIKPHNGRQALVHIVSPCMATAYPMAVMFKLNTEVRGPASCAPVKAAGHKGFVIGPEAVVHKGFLVIGG
jgi:hypothetical protein